MVTLSAFECLRIEVYDWSVASTKVISAGKELATITTNPADKVAAFEISDDGKGAEILLSGK